MRAAVSTQVVTDDAVQHRVLQIHTRLAMEFVDLTARLHEVVGESRIVEGLMMVQSRHTTAGLMINENEPLLLEDLTEMFERLVPTYFTFRHDDFARRHVTAAERVNGHAHCRAALLRTTECVPITDGRLGLGRWQRVFFVDFDGGQQRDVWLTLLGRRRRASAATA